MIRLQRKQNGFTILELVIASSVFGIVVLLLITGFIYIGRTYYKGVITSKTQETARSISNQVSDTYQFSGIESIGGLPEPSPLPKSGGLDTHVRCVGNIRYTYILNARVASTFSDTPGDNTATHALWSDVIRDPANCVALDLASSDPTDQLPRDSNTDDTSEDALAQRRDLVSQDMRLAAFDIRPAGSSVVNTNMTLIYGDQELSPTGTGCIGVRFGGQFCAITTLENTVKKRL